RHADVVLELQRGGPGTALGAVDDAEIRGGAHLPHRLADREHLVARAHAQLETGRFPAGELTHPGDELDQPGGGIEDFVCRGADAFLSLWDLPGRGDLRIDLGTGQYAADPGFGALAELEGDAFDLLSLGGVGEIVRIEVAVGSARAEVAGADLPDQITVMLFVVGGDAAFDGVVAKFPISAPLFRARIALGDSAAKLIAETFSSDIGYGLLQSGPPISARGGFAGCSTGATVCTRYSYPVLLTSRSVPKACSPWMPLAR